MFPLTTKFTLFSKSNIDTQKTVYKINTMEIDKHV